MLNSFILLLLISFSAMAHDCESVKIKYINNQKEVVKNETICFLPSLNNNNYFVSDSCKERDCEILKRPKSKIVIDDYLKNYGSPGFKLCVALGGQPQIFEYQTKPNSQQTTARCLFTEKDFIEISLLTHEWKSFVQTKNE